MSDSDDEMFEPSPEVVVPPTRRQASRRKASSPSPKKYPRKKAQRDILSTSDNNMEDDIETSGSDSGSDFEVPPQSKNRASGGRGRTPHPQTQKRGRTVVPFAEDSDDDDSGISRRVSKSLGDGVENTPPAHPAACEPVTPGSGQTSREDEPRGTRKRLSIRSIPDGPSSSTSSRKSGHSLGGSEIMPTPSEVQNIYETCSNLFNANRINQQNAFNLRLLDCINQMINSPGYDKSNMLLTSTTVEIGTKIYVCRVDNTHSHVLSLASDISLQQRRKKKNGDAEANDPENPENEGMEGDDMGDEEELPGKRQKQRRKGANKKRGRFVEEDNAKLLTGLEEQNVKYVTRRNFLKKKFNEMISEDLDFDYLNYCLEPEEEAPLENEQEFQNMKSPLQIAEPMINQADMSRLVFLPFHHLEKFDPDMHDLWGRSLNAEEMRDMSHAMPEINPDFAYDPATRPAEYPEEPEPDQMNETFGDAMFQCGDNGHIDGIPPVSFHQMKSLDGLEEYFQRIKNVLKASNSKHGWCGPNFVRPKSHWPAGPKGVRKPRVKKEPEPFDFTKINFSIKANKFNLDCTARTVFDHNVVESWSLKKTIIPFLGIELSNYEEDFHPLDLENENDPKYLPPIFKLFTSRRRSILELLKSRDRTRHDSGASNVLGSDHDFGGAEGFDDVELPRDIADDFCSQPENEGFHAPDFPTQAEAGAGWQIPGSLDLLTDEPLSLVSGVESIQFSRKPKPIDMNTLKKAIFTSLQKKLELNKEGAPMCATETKIDLAELMLLVLKLLDTKTEKLLSVPIFIVALMHVVADKRLFVIYDDISDPNCPVVICRGKNFNHYDYIPMPIGGGFD